MPRRRILQVFNRYLQYGGEERVVEQIAEAEQEINEVQQLTTSTAELMGSRQVRLSAAYRAVYNREIDRKLKQFQRVGQFDAWEIHNIFPLMSPIVYRRAFEWDIPIVHFLHNYRLSCVNGFFLNHGAPCQRCLSGNFWPAFLTRCWHESHLQSGWMGLITHHIRQMGVFEKVRQWIALSEAQKREHVRMGIPAERIAVVGHFLTPTAPPLAPSTEPTALFVGRLSLEKGVSQLLRAWKLVGGRGRKLIIVGDGPERANLEREAQGLAGVSFLGFLEHEAQRAAWQQALFSVVPSVWLEPFGLTVLEAWARGRPVVAHRIGALPELVDHGVTGLLAEPADAASLAEQMDRLFSAPAEAAAMGRHGFEQLATRFSRQRWLDQISEIYRIII